MLSIWHLLKISSFCFGKVTSKGWIGKLCDVLLVAYSWASESWPVLNCNIWLYIVSAQPILEKIHAVNLAPTRHFYHFPYFLWIPVLTRNFLGPSPALCFGWATKVQILEWKLAGLVSAGFWLFTFCLVFGDVKSYTYLLLQRQPEEARAAEF